MSEAKAFSALQLGIAAAKEGNHELARRLLLEATKFDENNRESWLWLATVAKSEAERESFLKYAAAAQAKRKAVPVAAGASNGYGQHGDGQNGHHPESNADIQQIPTEVMPKVKSVAQPIRTPEPVSKPAAWRCPICAEPAARPSHQCPSCRSIVTLTKVDDILQNEGVDQAKVQAAIDRYRLELSQSGDVRLHYKLALAHLNLKEIVQSIIHLNEAIRLQPDRPVLRKLVDLLRQKQISYNTNRRVAPPAPVAPQPQVESKRGVILVVDDSPTIRKAVSIILEKEGYEVFTAADGVQALSKLNGQSTELNGQLPDLILLDITMPHMDGYQVCKIVKGNNATKSIPVVMLSGKDGFFNKVRGRMVGSTEYITKPCNPQTLIKAVKKHAKKQVA
ncbi:MAG: response regulator [Chloroflexota bacterium]